MLTSTEDLLSPIQPIKTWKYKHLSYLNADNQRASSCRGTLSFNDCGFSKCLQCSEDYSRYIALKIKSKKCADLYTVILRFNVKKNKRFCCFKNTNRLTERQVGEKHKWAHNYAPELLLLDLKIISSVLIVNRTPLAGLLLALCKHVKVPWERNNSNYYNKV